MGYAIKTDNLIKRYKDKTAVDGLTLTVAEGELIALLDKYNEWDTFIIIVKTKNHKRMVLSESHREDCAKVLTELVSERKK